LSILHAESGRRYHPGLAAIIWHRRRLAPLWRPGRRAQLR